MTIAILFWVIAIIAVLFGGYSSYRAGKFEPIGGVLFVLILILGWAVFGAPVH